MCDRMDEMAVEAIHTSMHRTAESHRVAHDGLEDGQDFGRRLRNDLKNLARRRLLLQGLAQVTIPILKLGEEPDILDRDHCLIGEGLEERDLVVGEAAGL